MNHAGFDTSAFPGRVNTAWLKANTNLSWMGFYLGPAPSHPDSGWMGQRQAMVDQGWGLAPIYVGQQITGPGAKTVTAMQGAMDGANAVALMVKAGFPARSCVFLDLENGPPFIAPQTDYVRAWCQAVAAQGYTPGVYCSHAMAHDVATAVSYAHIWAFKVTFGHAHNVAGAEFPTPDPAGCGFASALMWQRDQNALIDCNGTPLLVDLNTSLTQDPSTP